MPPGQVAVADVDAACEPDLPVGHKDLPVIAQVDERRGRDQPGREKPGDGHAAFLQAPAGPAEVKDIAEAVDDDPQVNAAFGRTEQRVDKGLTGPVSFKNISGEKEGPPRPVNCLKHCRIGLFSAVQRLDAVAVHKRPVRENV